MRTFLNQILHLLGHDRRKLPLLVLLFLGASMFDLAGLGLIGPFIALVVDPETLEGPLGRVVDWTGLPREQKPLLIALGLGLFCIFLLKTVSVIVIQWVIIRFSRKQQLQLQMYLMLSGLNFPYHQHNMLHLNQFYSH